MVWQEGLRSKILAIGLTLCFSFLSSQMRMFHRNTVVRRDKGISKMP